MRRQRPAWLIAGTTFVLSACALPSYEPVSPHVATSEDLHAEVTKLDASAATILVTAKLEGGPKTRVRRALLAPLKAAPCHEGIREQRFTLDGKPQWLRPARVEGAHSALLVYAGAAALEILRQDAAIDFVVASPSAEDDRPDDDADACVRVPLNGPDPALAWRAEAHGFAGGSVRVYSPSRALGGVGLGWALVDSVGAYIGPVRVQGEVGFGNAICRSDCFDSGLGFVWFPVGASMHVPLLDRAGMGLDLGLAYRWFFSSVGGGGESRWVIPAGPELSFRIAGTADLGRGLPGGWRMASSGVEFMLADWRYHAPDGWQNAVVLGMALTWDHGF
jgi:hypothetical protein